MCQCSPPPERVCVTAWTGSVWADGFSSWKANNRPQVWLNRAYYSMLTGAHCVNIFLQLVPPALFVCPKRSLRGLSSGGYTLKGFTGRRLSVVGEKLKIKIFQNRTGDSICNSPPPPLQVARGHLLTSWHAGCHGCYENQGKRWLGYSLHSNCGGGVTAPGQMGIVGEGGWPPRQFTAKIDQFEKPVMKRYLNKLNLM